MPTWGSWQNLDSEGVIHSPLPAEWIQYRYAILEQVYITNLSAFVQVGFNGERMAIQTERKRLAFKVVRETRGVEVLVEGDAEVLLDVAKAVLDQVARLFGARTHRELSPKQLEARRAALVKARSACRTASARNVSRAENTTGGCRTTGGDDRPRGTRGN